MKTEINKYKKAVHSKDITYSLQKELRVKLQMDSQYHSTSLNSSRYLPTLSLKYLAERVMSSSLLLLVSFILLERMNLDSLDTLQLL